MKFRAVKTTSERELIVALRSCSRHVSLAQLSDWRKEGLLPPLASRGLGPNRGRCYYWDEKNILAHAQCVHDLLKRHRQHSIVILILWLCGHPAPLAKVRRAWLRHTRGVRSWPIRNAAPRDAALQWPYPDLLEGNRTDTVFLKTILKLSSSFTAGRNADTDALYDTLHRASDALGYKSEAAGGIQYHLFVLLRLIIASIENSSLLSMAKDEDLEAARRVTETAARLVQSLIGGEAVDFEIQLSSRMEIVGETFFLCALLLQRTGYRDHLSGSENAMRALLPQLAADTAGRERILAAFRYRLGEIWASPAGACPPVSRPGAESVRSREARKSKVSLALCLGSPLAFALQLLSSEFLAAITLVAA